MKYVMCLLIGALFFACNEQSEVTLPGELVSIPHNVTVEVLPMQTMGSATRGGNGKPEKDEDEAVSVTYIGKDAATRVQESETEQTVAESKINDAYILQFDGISSGSVLKMKKEITEAQLKSGSAIACTFKMKAGKNRVYVVANCAQTLTEGTTTLGDFESAVALPPSTELPSTGLPMSACQDVSADDSFDVFRLKSVLAKLLFTTNAGTLKLKGLPTGYSFYTTSESTDFAVRPRGMTYSKAGVDLIANAMYYIPENLSGRNKTLPYHSMRALGFAPTHAMYVEVTNGSTVYNLLLGDGSAPDFNVCGNNIYNVDAIINGTTAQTDLRVGDPIFTGSSLNNLNPDGRTANCYIATAAATWYMFRCDVMGNGATTPLPSNMDANSIASPIIPSALNPRSASVLWETRNTATDPAKGDVVNNNLYLFKDRILFRTGTTEGNAIIAAHDASNTIIWSWHIWRTNTNPTVAPQTLSSFTATSGTFDATGTATLSGLKILDRSLGALSATAEDDLSTGLLYQWGRKDPFPGGATLNAEQTTMATTLAASVITGEYSPVGYMASLGDAVKNPTTFYTGNDWTSRNDNLWGTPILRLGVTPMMATVTIGGKTFNSSGGSKSIYDPCPSGWRVPPGYAFANASVAKGGTFSKGFSFSILTSGSSWFPAAGSSNGTLNVVGTYGYYWTSAPLVNNPAYGSSLLFNSSRVDPTNINGRSRGIAVRCAQE